MFDVFIVSTSCLLSVVSILSNSMSVMDCPADMLVVVLVDDVDLPDSPDDRARRHKPWMCEISAKSLQGQKPRIFSEKGID
jgi:hypothetical protein